MKMEPGVDEQIEMSRRESAFEVGDDFAFMRLKGVFGSKISHSIIYLVQPGNFSSQVLDVLTMLFCCSFCVFFCSIKTKVCDQFKCFSFTNRSLGLIRGFVGLTYKISELGFTLTPRAKC